jgi:hypothetical protein
MSLTKLVPMIEEPLTSPRYWVIFFPSTAWVVVIIIFFSPDEFGNSPSFLSADRQAGIFIRVLLF